MSKPRWEPPDQAFRPAEMFFRPDDPDEDYRALPGLGWDGDAHAALVGKTVIIGITFHDRNGDEYGRT